MELAPQQNNNRIANYRPAFVFAIGVMLGIAACGMFENTGAYLLAVLFAVIGGILLIFKHYRFAAFALALLIGLIAAFIAKPKSFQRGSYLVSGIVMDTRQKDESTVLVLDRCTLNGEKYNKRIELSSEQGAAFAVGDAVSAFGDCRMLYSRAARYSENSSKLSAGIGCIASAGELHVLSSHNAPLNEFVLGIRSKIDQKIHAVFGEDAGVFSALIIGVKDEVGEERYSVFRTAGAAHLLAISGLHMSVIVSAVSVFLPKWRRVLKAVVLGLFMFAYCTVAAYAPGLVRAAIMTFLMLLADCFGRQRDSLSALSVAALLILAFNPYQLYSIGFQLSFSACFGLNLLTRSISGTLTRIKLPTKLAQPAAVSLSATAGTLPFQMLYFNSFAPYSLIANLVAVPLFSVIVVLGFAVTLFSFIWQAGAGFAAIVPRAVLFCAESFLGLIGKLPFANTEFASPSVYCCILWMLMLFAASEYMLRPRGKRFLYAACLCALFTTLYIVGIIRA